MQYLRADTITEVTIGPAVAVGDGFTPVTGLVGADGDEFEIIKHGATTTTTIAGTLAPITGADGYYALDLSATDTDTEGRLTILINDDSLILPLRHEFMVVNANVYDSLFAAETTDYLQVDCTQWRSGAIPAQTQTGVPEVDVTFWLGTGAATPTVPGVPEVDVTHYAGQTTNVSTMPASVAAIEVDTGTSGVLISDGTGTGQISLTAGSVDNVGTVTTTGTATNVTTVNGLAGDVITAASIASGAAGELRTVLLSGTADSGNTLTCVDAAALTQNDDDYWKGCYIHFTSGNIAGQVRLITAFTASSDTITFTPATTQAVATQTYEILPAAHVEASGSVTGNVDGNVTGTVGAAASVTGNVDGNVTGSVGSVAGNVDGNVTGTVGAAASVTGNVGGNVTGSVGSVAGNVDGNVTGTVNAYTNGTYSGNRVYINGNDGTTGTTLGVGTDSNPHNGASMADVATLAAAVNTSSLFCQPNTTITQDQVDSFDNFVIDGDNYSFVYTAVATDNLLVRNATITSTGTPTGTGNAWQLCTIGTVTMPNGVSTNGCTLDGTASVAVGVGHTAALEWTDLYGSGGTIDFNSENVTTVDIHMIGGEITLHDVDDVTAVNLYGNGKVTITETSSGLGDGFTLTVYGDIDVVDSTQGLDTAPVYVNDNVLAQANAALDTAIDELTQGVPVATPSMRTGLMLLYMALRNKTDVATSATDTLEIHSDDGTRIAQKLLTDAAGDYSEAKMISGV